LYCKKGNIIILKSLSFKEITAEEFFQLFFFSLSSRDEKIDDLEIKLKIHVTELIEERKLRIFLMVLKLDENVKF
jgi:hypothetical protein